MVEDCEGEMVDHSNQDLALVLKIYPCDMSFRDIIIIIAWDRSCDPLVCDPGPKARVVGLVRDDLDATIWELNLVFPLSQLACSVLHVPVVVTCDKENVRSTTGDLYPHLCSGHLLGNHTDNTYPCVHRDLQYLYIE